MVSATEALQRLRDGNQRFVAGTTNHVEAVERVHRTKAADGQNPFAIVLACSDSRVPIELIFDQGIGDLFVIRVAGNIVAPSQIGSVEFAAKQFGTRLVLVLGHSNCGAVIATLNELALRNRHRSPNLRSIVDRIRPAVEPLLREHTDDNIDEILADAVRANIRASVERLSHGSLILEQLVESGDLAVIGAEYSIENGAVDFFEGV